ncbi:hypothetical protein Memar_0213 [Methanoculleus marisnigri JR1]|uniref:Uncharacterized protein n=1 Tax=Methanoculleus marisnigri (strain ATCC 35101 / DSM 1498 / JR1) TaxID=368407 RepID=A3CRZ7_METMJ|nr:hypothetical protein Memar_0213 [Methanoculleus marisnigri JR1]
MRGLGGRHLSGFYVCYGEHTRIGRDNQILDLRRPDETLNDTLARLVESAKKATAHGRYRRSHGPQ